MYFGNIESRRIFACWSCYTPLNDLPTCPICGWMICPECGSCRSPLYEGGCVRRFTNKQNEMNQLRALWLELPEENRYVPPSEEFNSWVQENLDEWNELELQRMQEQRRIEEEKKREAELNMKEIQARLEAGRTVEDVGGRIGVLDHFHSDSRFHYVAIRYKNGVTSYCFPSAFTDGFLHFVYENGSV